MALLNATLQKLLRTILTNAESNDVLFTLGKAEFDKFCFEYFKQIARTKFSGIKLSQAVDSYGVDNIEQDYDHVIFKKNNPPEIAIQAIEKVIAKVPISYPDELPIKVPVILDDTNPGIEFKPILQRNGISIELTLQETLIVVNTLAAKHAEIRGGAVSGLGKRLALPLMLTLVKLYQVSSSHYAGKGLTGENRDVDFHFLNRSGDRFFCEVKLMGKGNPESADAIIARDTDIFIADTLSTLNKEQLVQRGCRWVELRAIQGYRRIFEVFNDLNIPCVDFVGDLDTALDDIIPQVFAEID